MRSKEQSTFSDPGVFKNGGGRKEGNTWTYASGINLPIAIQSLSSEKKKSWELKCK